MSREEALGLAWNTGGAAEPVPSGRDAAPRTPPDDRGEPELPAGRRSPGDIANVQERGVAYDWRSTLRATGAEPDPVAATAAGGSRERRTKASSSTADAKAPPQPGLDVSTPASDLFAGGPPLDSLEQVAAAVATCTRCPLYRTATKSVPGEGNPNADLMFVGEAPGATEDETGRPFVGAAGQLLTKIIEAIDFDRGDVFICNVLKHRPPGNRNPLPDEVRACSPYLVRQIELVRPKVIVALGTFAAQTLLDTKLSIGKLRGKVHRYHGVPLVVTYHPAALLRNPAWKRPTWDDVKLARRILDGTIEEASPGN
jgi:uracil-DNA glycosylase family 4